MTKGQECTLKKINSLKGKTYSEASLIGELRRIFQINNCIAKQNKSELTINADHFGMEYKLLFSRIGKTHYVLKNVEFSLCTTGISA